MIYDKIKSDFMSARKARNTEQSAFLSFVLGQIENSSDVKINDDGKKIYTDDIVLTVVKNLDKKLKEVPSPNQDEIEALNAYLPQMLGVDEIRAILADVDGGMKEKMNYMKTNFPFQYDGKVASMVAKET